MSLSFLPILMVVLLVLYGIALHRNHHGDPPAYG